MFIAPQNLRFESGALICFLIYKFILDKLFFPSYNALTAEEKSHWGLGLFSLFSTAFRIYFLTTSLTIVRFGLCGFSITREHLFPWFCLHGITKRYYLTLKKLKTLGWGDRGHKLKFYHSCPLNNSNSIVPQNLHKFKGDRLMLRIFVELSMIVDNST